jgi:hypothetical protein
VEQPRWIRPVGQAPIVGAAAKGQAYSTSDREVGATLWEDRPQGRVARLQHRSRWRRHGVRRAAPRPPARGKAKTRSCARDS